MPPSPPSPPTPPPQYEYHYWKCYSTIGNSKVVTIYTKEVDYYTWGECEADPATNYYLCGDRCSRCANGQGHSTAGAGALVETRLVDTSAHAFSNPWAEQ